MEIVEELERMEEWFTFHQVGDKSIYVLAFLLFVALLIVLLSKKMKVPIVVGYVFLGILLSTDVIKALPFLTEAQKHWYLFTLGHFNFVPSLALAFIAFTIGSELSIKVLKRLGKSISYISLLESGGAFLIVTLAVLAIGRPLYMALLLGAIASATAPAATVMVLREYRAEGALTSTIMAVVGIDDAIALIIFSLIEPVAFIEYSGEGVIALNHILVEPLVEIFGSVAIGLAIGYLSQYLVTGFGDSTKKIMTLVATVVGTSGLAIALNFSPLISNMAVGFAYRNFARKNLGIGDFLDTLTTPLYALFFILAGTEIKFTSIASVSFLIVAFTYLVARIAGKVSGASLGAYLGKAPEEVKKYIGFGLLPQSGVAIALAYTVQKDFSAAPAVGLMIFNTLLFTAAMTEVFGPLATKYAITRAGEVQEYVEPGS